MDNEILNLLNDSACSDVHLVLPASQRLTFLSNSKEMRNYLYSSIANLIFMKDVSNLSDDGKFVGFIYLKNAMFDSRIWQNVDPNIKNDVQRLLFIYLADGQDNKHAFNKHEDKSGTGRFVIDIVARYVKNEWLKSDWSDGLWEKLIEWCAWSSLRAGIKAAGTFRLPARRKAFNCLLNTIFPNLVERWDFVLNNFNIETITSVIQLTRLLHTCLILGDNIENENNAQFFDSLNSIMFKSFLVLDQHFAALIYTDDLNCQKLFYCLTKLIFSVFIRFNPQTRCKIVHCVINKILTFISTFYYSDNLVFRPSFKWLLGVIYCIFSRKGSVCNLKSFLTVEDEVKV